MIYTTSKIRIKNYQATIDKTIILYRGDRNVEIQFEILESAYREYKVEGSNVILNLNASYGQLIVQKPDHTHILSDIVPTQDGKVIFTIPEKLIDETLEVGKYTFQIRLYNGDQTSRVTLPPVAGGMEIAEPIAIDESFVDTAMAGYAMVQTDSEDEEDKRFDENGNYIKTYWEHGDIITAGKLNKVEDSLEAINANDIQNHIEVNEKIDALVESIDAAEYVTETELNAKGYLTEHQDISGKADKTELPTKTSQLTNDSGFLTQIPNEYVTETELNAKGYLTEHQDISGKADKTELHNHTNKSVLDGITASKVSSWDNSKVAYGTCSTAAATAEKTVVVEDAKWELEVGSMVAIRFSATNSASNVTINVNGTGAYPIWASSAEYTSTGSSYTGYENRTYIYMFNGTHWVWISNGSYPSSTTNASLGHGYGVCSTAEATLAKTCTISSYSLSAGGSVSIKFTNAVPANSTLNIRTRGAKKIFYKGAAISDGVIKAGDTATFVYDGTQYQLISIDSPSTSSDNNTTNSFGNSELADTKLYLGGVKEVGTSSSSYDTSFVNSNVFIGTDNALYSENKKVATEEFVVNEIAKIDTSDEIVDSIEEMTNTNKQYVLSSTNTWWQYKTKTLQAGSVLPDVDNAIKWDTCTVHLNKRYNSSALLTDAPGCATFEFTVDDAMSKLITDVDPLWVRFKGCSPYSTEGNPTSLKFVTHSKNGNLIHSWTPASQVLAYIEDENGINNNSMSGTVYLKDNTKAPVYAIKLGYCNTTVSDNNTNTKDDYFKNANMGKFAFSIAVNFANKNPITESDLENVYITFNEPIVTYETQTISEWRDTGIEYNQNADIEVVELQIKVTNIENRVEILESKSSTSGGASSNVSTLPDYWISRLNDIGDKIDTLQKENGMDTLQFLWCSDIHGVPGTSPSNTTYIGEIGRYMMDKHNIPFFMVSGDIMSQASHSSTGNIWTEYDKLTTMLSPIKNEEFLAIKGNHDGAWGSPMEYNGQANQYYHSYIGDKALFNAFMRRQTLDRYKRVFGKEGMYFYIDCHNYRIYMLNGHTFGDNSVNEQGQAIYNGFKHPILGSEQIQWIADTLNTVQENQQVIFVCHAQLNQQLDFEVFRTMLSHYNNRTSGNSSKSISGTYWGTDAKYSQVQANFDFTNAKGSVVGWFNGHIHTDSIKTDLFDNLPIFTITTAGGDVRDSYYTNGTLTRAKGTVTETAIDIVTITSDYIYFTRIGSGYDRKFNRASKEVTIDYDSAYVPPVEPPVDNPDEPEITQGEITDQITWKSDTRLSSSSGDYSTQQGVYASNDISVENGDVIRIYGATKWNNYAYVNGYSASGFLINMDVTLGTSLTNNYYTVVIDEKMVMTITITHSNVSYIRVCGSGLGNGSIRVSRNLDI